MLPLLRLRRLRSQQGLLLACAGDVARATRLRIAINIAGHVAVEVSRRHGPLGTGFFPNVTGKRARQVVIGVWSTSRAVDDLTGTVPSDVTRHGVYSIRRIMSGVPKTADICHLINVLILLRRYRQDVSWRTTARYQDKDKARVVWSSVWVGLGRWRWLAPVSLTVWFPGHMVDSLAAGIANQFSQRLVCPPPQNTNRDRSKGYGWRNAVPATPTPPATAPTGWWMPRTGLRRIAASTG